MKSSVALLSLLVVSCLSASVRRDDDIPEKYATSYALPQYFQEDRGTCWDFATIGLVEQSYRQHGVEKGWLAANQYVRFSEQAYGIAMVRECQNHPDICKMPGDLVYWNNTDGGEMPWLYSLTKLYDQILPLSVCPYTDGDHDLDCPGMDEALKTNPIAFDIPAMHIAYSVEDTRRLLWKTKQPLGWSSLMFVDYFYYPCNDEYAQLCNSADTDDIVPCPTDQNYGVTKCLRKESSMYNMDGEFFAHGNMVPEGGHGMNVVGFNDEFVTKSGHIGGFIIKNSWHDFAYGTNEAGRGARGSHSIKYWMQNISAWDEKVLCPEPLNPDNWLSCVNQQNGPSNKVSLSNSIPAAHKLPLRYTNSPAAVRGGFTPVDISTTCLDADFMEFLVDVTLQPTEFTCLDNTWCDPSPKFRYFLISMEPNVQGDLRQACMMMYDTVAKTQSQICTPHLHPSHLAYIWAPISAQQTKLGNNPDFCGYYFWSYDTLREMIGLYENFYTLRFDFVWDDCAYAANKGKPACAGKDYTLVASSTGVQKTVDFGASPFPNGNVRYQSKQLWQLL